MAQDTILKRDGVKLGRKLYEGVFDKWNMEISVI